MTIAEVAQATGLAPAAARRMLLTLSDLGYVQQNGKRFRVGPKVLDLGYSYISSMPMWQVVQPMLERISQQFKLSSGAAVLEGSDIVFAVRANVWQPSAVVVSTGTRQPAHVTAMGRVLLASLSLGELELWLSRCSFRSYTSHSVRDVQNLLVRLEDVRNQGYAIVDQEYEFGLRAVAVPLRDRRGQVVAAMNAAGNSDEFSIRSLQDNVLPVLIRSSRVVQSQM